MSHQNYRFKCRHGSCTFETSKFLNKDEFDSRQYNNDRTGFQCETCGYPRMAVMKSNKSVDDTFKAGFQRNIRKYCETETEYKAHLKQMGLIEIGYEKLPYNESAGSIDYWSEDNLKYLYDNLDLSENELMSLVKEDKENKGKTEFI